MEIYEYDEYSEDKSYKIKPQKRKQSKYNTEQQYVGKSLNEILEEIQDEE